jgi:ABC-2 type transport system permease protein
MPIYDLGYRHWTGRWTSHPYRWWAITRRGVGLLAKNKRFIALMILSGIPFLVRAVMIYASTLTGRNVPLLRIDAKFFEDFLSQQMQFFGFFIAIFAGAGLIANDLKANALQIYLSKPITRQDYLLGKLGILVFFLALPTLVPGLLLFLIAILFKSDIGFVHELYWVPGSIVAYSVIIMFSFALIMLALSSLSKSSRFAGINFIAVFFFSQILYGILSSILRTSRVAWVSLRNNLTQVGDLLFGRDPRYLSPGWVSILVLAVLACGSVWIIHRRIQAVEVVS